MSPIPTSIKTENLSNVAVKEKALEAAYDASLTNKEIWTNKFTIHEFFGYSFLAVLYYFVVRFFFYCGLTTDMIVILICVLTVYEVTVAKWKIKYDDRTLKMRKLTKTGGEMYKTSEVDNPFWEEEDRGFLHIGDHIDYAVMKYVGDDVPMIVEQEYQHAQLHHESQAQKLEDDAKAYEETLKEQGAMLNGLRKMLLRRTQRFGILMCGMIEASNTYGLLFTALLGFRPGTLFSFHVFEEAEHAAVTVQNLKKKTTAFERVLFFPLFCAFMLPQLVMFPILFAKKPALLLRPKTYLEFPEYTMFKVLGLVGSITSVFLHWVLPVPQPAALHYAVHSVLEKRVRDCGLDWEIEKEVTYPLYL